MHIAFENLPPAVQQVCRRVVENRNGRPSDTCVGILWDEETGASQVLLRVWTHDPFDPTATVERPILTGPSDQLEIETHVRAHRAAA